MKQTSNLIQDLVPEMQEKAENVLFACKEAGVTLNIYCTFRSLSDQAKLYCRGLPKTKVQLKIDYIRNTLSIGEIADILEEANKTNDENRHRIAVTKAPPAFSFHNYGEAFDAVPMIGGKCIWGYKTEDEKRLWNIYGQAVRDNGLFWAGDWKHFTERPHAQLRVKSNPLKILKPDEAMKLLREINAL